MDMQYISHYESPLGSILLAADDIGLTGLWFEGQRYFARGLDEAAEEKDLPRLVEALESSRPEIRFWGAAGIGQLAASGKTDTCPERLEELLDDENPYVACEAAYAMVWCGDAEKGLHRLLHPAREEASS